MYSKKVRKNVKEEVNKVLRCRDLNHGFIEFRCDECNVSKKIGFSCRSRFCTSCGKVYTDKWVENMLGNLINVKHRHIVFTIPVELRDFFRIYIQRLKILLKCAAKAVTSWMHKLNKSEEFTPGIVTVIHTFGRDLKWNPHVHMMVTEGGTGKKTEWKHIRHFSYEALRKRWQKLLLDEVKSISGNSKPLRTLINKLYRNNIDGFYVHAKSEIKSVKTAAKYVGRSAIAESRILQYDGTYVTYKYTRREDNKVVIEKVHVYEFIKKLIIHIPEKRFNMEETIKYKCTQCKLEEDIPKEVVEYFDEMDQSNIDQPPCFSCEKCGGIMRPLKYDGVYGKKYRG